jgi:hypothetical protein
MAIALLMIASVVLVSAGLFFLIRREVRTAREETLEAFRNALRRAHGEPCPHGAAEAVSPSPAPIEVVPPVPVPVPVAREALPADVEPPSTVPSRSRPVPMGDQSARAVERWQRRAIEIREESSAPSAESEPTSAEIAAAFHAEADKKDARDALNPPAPTDADVIARFQGTAPGENAATLRRDHHELPSVEDEGDRSTDEELTRVQARKRQPPPHAPPRPIGGRPTLLGGLAGAPLEQPTSDPKRTAREFAARAPREPSWNQKRAAQLRSEGMGAEEARRQAEEEGRAANASPGAKRDRDTLTPTDPSAPTLDARVERLWHEKIAAAQEAGQNVAHCHGERCMHRGEGIALCDCRCEGCARLLALLIAAERDVRRSQ